MEKRLIPEIRFKGFVGKWEEKRFRDYVKLSQGLQIPIAERLVKETKDSLFYITNEFLNPNSKVKYYIKNAKENVKAHKDDILMTRTGNTGKVVTDIEGVFHNNFFKVAYEKQETDKYFLYHLLKSPMIQKEILVRAGTSTIPDLNHGDFYGIKHCTPKTDEQEKIGRLFENLDQTIDLQGKVVEENKRLKQALLQKLFPKKGQKLPELRLKGFSGDWEEKRLKDISDSYTTLTGKTKEDFGKGQGRFVTFSNILANPITDKNQLGQIEIDDKQNSVKRGDIFFNISSETPEEVGLSSVWTHDIENVFVNSFCTAVRPKVEIDLYFISQILRSEYVRKQIMILAQGISRYNISKVKLMEIKIPIPSLPEQEAIGNLFRSLDEKIAREEERLEGYKTLKKSLLQKMFV